MAEHNVNAAGHCYASRTLQTVTTQTATSDNAEHSQYQRSLNLRCYVTCDVSSVNQNHCFHTLTSRHVACLRNFSVNADNLDSISVTWDLHAHKEWSVTDTSCHWHRPQSRSLESQTGLQSLWLASRHKPWLRTIDGLWWLMAASTDYGYKQEN